MPSLTVTLESSLGPQKTPLVLSYCKDIPVFILSTGLQYLVNLKTVVHVICKIWPPLKQLGVVGWVGQLGWVGLDGLVGWMDGLVGLDGLTGELTGWMASIFPTKLMRQKLIKHVEYWIISHGIILVSDEAK